MRWMEDYDGTEVCRDCGHTPYVCRCYADAELEEEAEFMAELVEYKAMVEREHQKLEGE